MDTEVIALVDCYRALLPIFDMFTFLDDAIGLPKYPTTMHSCIHEDNWSIDFGRDSITSV